MLATMLCCVLADVGAHGVDCGSVLAASRTSIPVFGSPVAALSSTSIATCHRSSNPNTPIAVGTRHKVIVCGRFARAKL
ncbi:MAG TPA: hypothetical protein PLF10_03495, partial [Dokdonella sp.]|nr:hypothetical protein [Dokdonella sp.]